VKDLADRLMPIDLTADYWNNIDQKPLYILPGYKSKEDCSLDSKVCQVHWQVEVEHLIKAQKEHPRAVKLVNILCQPELLALADKIGDAQSLWDFCGDNPAKEFIVVSEMGLSESLAAQFPQKTFYDPGVEIFCPNMKLTNLRDMIAVLESFQLRAGLVTHFGTRPLGGQFSHDLPG
jgi:quinolinate synthase